MLLEASIDKNAVTIQIDDPFNYSLQQVTETIARFAASKDVSVEECDLGGLIPKMIRGIAGCESGCPANARELVERGVRNATLEYIEGGILSARFEGRNGSFFIKIFPDF